MPYDYKSCPLKKRPFVCLVDNDENRQHYNNNNNNNNAYVIYETQSEPLALIKSPEIELPQDLSIKSSALNLSKREFDETPLNLTVNNQVCNWQTENSKLITNTYECETKTQTAQTNIQAVRSFQHVSNQFQNSFAMAAGCNPSNLSWNACQPILSAIYPSPSSSNCSDGINQSLYNCQQFSPPLSPRSEVMFEAEDLSITKDIPLPALFHDLNEKASKSSSAHSYRLVQSPKPSNCPTKNSGLECKNCHKWYSNALGLAKHQQLHCAVIKTNKPNKEFKCEECGKLYHTSSSLKMHIRTHTLPCKCDICGKAFSRPWLLRGHIRTHTGEKPFQCPDCSRSFADRSNLKAHQQIHASSKRYSCRHCNKTFSRSAFLKKHMEDHCACASH